MTKELSYQESHGCIFQVYLVTLFSEATIETPLFLEQDYQFYLECLCDAEKKYHVKIYAYKIGGRPRLLQFNAKACL